MKTAIIQKANKLVQLCTQKHIKISTAESCTGGLLGAFLTDIPGSSSVFERGFITYSNEAKIEMLSVDPKLIEEFGAVSTQVAEAMAQGSLKNSIASFSISTTGIAGPGGGSDYKPVGTVCFGLASNAGIVKSERKLFDLEYKDEGREGVRLASVLFAFEFLLKQIEIK